MFRTCFSILTIIALFLVTGTASSAYRTILTPTANVLAAEEWKLEVQALDLGADHANLYRADTGIPGAFELQIVHLARENQSRSVAFGLEKQIVPETGLTPAIAVGIMDISNVAEKGRSPYAVASLSLPVEKWNLPVRNVTLNVGVGGGFFVGAFGGASVCLPLGLGFEVENDSHGFNYAGTWSLNKQIKLRALSIKGDNAYSLTYTIHPSSCF